MYFVPGASAYVCVCICVCPCTELSDHALRALSFVFASAALAAGMYKFDAFLHLYLCVVFIYVLVPFSWYEHEGLLRATHLQATGDHMGLAANHLLHHQQWG